MIVIALDFGERRIGVAVSDPLNVTSRPLTVIERASLAEDIATLSELVKQRGAKMIVLGLPLNMDGSVGPQARRVRRFASRLRRELEVETVLWDERLTTVEAESVLISADRSREERRRQRDAVAAAIILRDYLEAQRRSEEE